MNWSLRFVQIDEETDSFIEMYKVTAPVSGIQQHFLSYQMNLPECTDKPDCLIDLLDEHDAIVDDLALSREVVLREIAALKKLLE